MVRSPWLRHNSQSETQIYLQLPPPLFETLQKMKNDDYDCLFHNHLLDRNASVEFLANNELSVYTAKVFPIPESGIQSLQGPTLTPGMLDYL